MQKEVLGKLHKKGVEVRLVAATKDELTQIRRRLRQASFKRTKLFAEDNQWRQPLYGVAEVARFLSLVGEPETE